MFDGLTMYEGIESEELERFNAFRETVSTHAVNTDTLLATDYLNHFNEVIMQVEMLADMPDWIDELLEWTPKSYEQHFEDSSLPDKAQIIEAYHHAPALFREALQIEVDTLVDLVSETLQLAAIHMAQGAPENLRPLVQEFSAQAETSMTNMRKVIAGGAKAVGHTADKALEPEEAEVMDQSAIDALFD